MTLGIEGIDTRSAAVISKAQTSSWESQVLSDMGNTNETYATFKGKERSAVRSEVLGRLNSKVGEYIDKNGKDMYFLEIDGTYAIFDNYVYFHDKIFNFTATFLATGSAPQTNSNIVVGVSNGGKVLFSKQFNNPFGVNPSQWMPIAPTSDGGLIAVQNYANTPTHVLWQKLDADRKMEWSDMTNTTVKTDIHGVIERPDGTYAAIGNYGDYNMLMLSKGVNKVGCLDSLFANTVDSVGLDVNTTTTTWSSSADSLNNAKSSFSNYPCVVADLTSSINRGSINCAVPTCTTIHEGPLLCGNATPVFSSVVFDTTNSCTDAENYAVMAGTDQYKAYRDSLSGNFAKEYLDTALAGGQRELFTLTYTSSEYHYTLYYYNQAGNLIKTIPPAGVVIDRSDAWAGKVKAARANHTLLVPAHKMATHYRYNTLNQVVSKKTPDDGISNYWYDRLGRVAVSQNSKQIGENKYSYTQYDPLGRPIEVGEISNTAAMNDLISRDTLKLTNWIAGAKSTRTQITVTNYDVAYSALPAEHLVPENLRNRVSWVAIFNDALAYDTMGFAMASYYSYDIHGNVKTLLHDYKQRTLRKYNNRWKKIQYKYDLISGKGNWVGYQPDKKDAFYHRYSSIPALDNNGNNITERARRANLPIMKAEKYSWPTSTGIGYFLNDNFGFPGNAGSVHFNGRIMAIDYIYKSTPGLYKAKKK